MLSTFQPLYYIMLRLISDTALVMNWTPCHEKDNSKTI
jgi:hypothetical protein